MLLGSCLFAATFAAVFHILGAPFAHVGFFAMLSCVMEVRMYALEGVCVRSICDAEVTRMASKGAGSTDGERCRIGDVIGRMEERRL